MNELDDVNHLMPPRQSEIERRIVDALKGTVLDREGILYGYLYDMDEDAVRRAIQRLRRRGVIETDPTARRGFYRLVEPS